MVLRRSPRFRPYTRKTRKWKKTTPKTRTIATQTVDGANILRKLSVPRNVLGFPKEIVTKIRYCDAYQLTSASNAPSARQYMRMNSINDPDASGVGHQPLWHDQWAAAYGKYVVLYSKMIVTFSHIPNTIATSQPSGPVIVGVLGDDNASTSSTTTTLLENSIWRNLGHQTGGNNTVTLYVTYSPKKDLGLPPEDDTVGALVSNNPSAQYYGGMYCIEAGTAASTTVSACVTVEYTVRFSRPVDPSGS